MDAAALAYYHGFGDYNSSAPKPTLCTFPSVDDIIRELKKTGQVGVICSCHDLAKRSLALRQTGR